MKKGTNKTTLIWWVSKINFLLRNLSLNEFKILEENNLALMGHWWFRFRLWRLPHFNVMTTSNVENIVKKLFQVNYKTGVHYTCKNSQVFQANFKARAYIIRYNRLYREDFSSWQNARYIMKYTHIDVW